MENTDRTYSLNELAMMTGFTTRTLRTYLDKGLLRGEKPGGVWQFTAEEVDRFFQKALLVHVGPAHQAQQRRLRSPGRAGPEAGAQLRHPGHPRHSDPGRTDLGLLLRADEGGIRPEFQLPLGQGPLPGDPHRKR